MLNSARLIAKHEDLQQGLWAKCVDTATKIENLAVKIGQSPPFQLFFKKNPPYLHSLHIFGKIGIANDAQKL